MKEEEAPGRPRLSPCSLGERAFAAVTSGQRTENDVFKTGRYTVMMIYCKPETR